MAKKRRKRELDEEEPGRVERVKIKFKELVQFLSYDIWRQNPETLSNKRNILYDATKTIILTIRNIQEQDLGGSARSLTYRTVLSIVPMLAILFAIARGFGIENIVESSIFDFLAGDDSSTEMVMQPAPIASDTLTLEAANSGTVINRGAGEGVRVQEEVSASATTKQFLNLLFGLIDNSLKEAKGGGIFAGIGILLFLYTIMLLFSNIENSFNRIWQIGKGRPIQRRVVDYFAFVLLMPIFFIFTNALNLIGSPEGNLLKIIHILYPIVPRLVNVLPVVIIILMLTMLYKFIPNTKVKFINALIAGIVAGLAFQVFQMLYLSGQLWISRYNAIYGTFAAVPLMLMWLQLSWFIVLIGAEISYAAQNVRKFSFEKETRNISRRYKDFFTIMITSVIVQRFADELPPLTADQISVKCKVPLKLTNDILTELEELDILSITPSHKDHAVSAYQPAVDINLITVNYLMTKIDENGSEDFMIDMEGDFQEHWKALVSTRMCMYEDDKDMLLRDL